LSRNFQGFCLRFCWQPGHRHGRHRGGGHFDAGSHAGAAVTGAFIATPGSNSGGEHGVTVGLMSPDPFMQWKGIGFLAVFDVVFLTALWLFGEYLLEE